jgi:hypothetical protein
MCINGHPWTFLEAFFFVSPISTQGKTFTWNFVWTVLPKCDCIYMGFEVLTEMMMSMALVWILTPWGLADINQRFGGKPRLYLQGDGVTIQKTNTQALLKNYNHSSPSRWRQYAPLKRRSTATGLYGAISQPAVTFIPAAVRTRVP